MQDIFEYKDCITPVKAIPSINIYGVDKVGDRKPTFTIAIPTYKRIRTLGETIESALNQEDFDDYNIIVVDNNPERGDETEVFMQKYKDHPKVTYYKNSENVGMAGNWNKCAVLSEADQFILLHDDDILYTGALSSFIKCLSILPQNWSLLKPELDKFEDINKLKKTKRNNPFLQKLSFVNFFENCPVGAPSGILINKNKLLEVGGFSMEKYPCIDYEASLKLARNGNAYLLFGYDSLGGYRVSLNESLSEKTMDNYFIQRSVISKQLMRKCRVPNFAVTILDAYFEKLSYKVAIQYYNMPFYRLKTTNELQTKAGLLSKLVLLVFLVTRKFINISNKKNILI